jgi:hypothetical protein
MGGLLMRVSDVDTVNALAKAWVAVGPSPCEYHACEWAARCGAERMACDAFRLYAERGRTVTPYAVVQDSRQRGLQVVALAHQVQPTREIYAALFPSGAQRRHTQQGACDATGG